MILLTLWVIERPIDVIDVKPVLMKMPSATGYSCISRKVIKWLWLSVNKESNTMNVIHQWGSLRIVIRV